jgi:hypothetical protein
MSRRLGPESSNVNKKNVEPLMNASSIASRSLSLFVGVAASLSISLTAACGVVDPEDGENQSSQTDSLRESDDGGAPVCTGMMDVLPAGECLSNAEWKPLVAKGCVGGEIQDFQPDNACGEGSSNSVSYKCCGGKEPACFGTGFAAPNGECLGEPVATYRAEAEKECAAAGGSLETFTTSGECGRPGYATGVYWSCCGVKPTDPNEPGPPSNRTGTATR